MDKAFIDRATRISSFNLMSSDFTTLTYKKEIQYIFNMFFFPKFNLNKTLDRVEKTKLNTLISELKTESAESFEKIHKYPLYGVGPGEVTLFFLLNTAYLGGGSSAGVDLIDSSGKYEIKAVKVSDNRIATGLGLGGTVPLYGLMNRINNLREILNLSGSSTEISEGLIKQIREKKKEEFQSIEQEYAKLAGEYFKGHKVIFINNGTNKQKRGLIEDIAEVRMQDIMIERVTTGTIKPLIQLRSI